MKDGMSVSLFDTVNSAIIFNMEIKKSVTVKVILTATMIIVFNCIQMSL